MTYPNKEGKKFKGQDHFGVLSMSPDACNKVMKLLYLLKISSRPA
jgi:hypothetical protein